MVHIKTKQNKTNKQKQRQGKSVWFFTPSRYHCFCLWKRGIFLSDLSWVSRHIAEVEMLPNQERFSSYHCLKGHLSWLDLSPSFSLSLSHAFYIYLNIGQKVIVAKRNLNCIICSVACELEFLGTI